MNKRIDKDFWLINRPIAHRGLFNNSAKIPENSYKAYNLAIENGFPIEMDIQLTLDGVVVCFHDDNLKRMTGFDKNVSELTYSELSKLKLLDTDESIPLFSEFLDFIGGRTPLLIEFKPQKQKGLEETVVPLLKKYDGEFVVQSFDPFSVLRLKKLAPEFIRGQLSTGEYHRHLSRFKNYILRNMLLNCITKPDFINYDFRYLPLKKSLIKGRSVICWTIRSEADKMKIINHCDNYIFEK